MRFMAHWKMRPAPAEEVERLLEEDLKFCKDLMKKGKLLHSFVLAGKPEGFEIFEVESNEEMHELAMNAPFGPFLDFDIWPLVDFNFSLNTLKSVLKKRL